MTAAPEDIYAALFALVNAPASGSPVSWNTPPQAFVTMSRRVKLFSDVPSDQQPAFFQAEHDVNYAQVSNMPYKRVFEAQWIVYLPAPADDSPTAIPPTTNMNLCRGALEAALAPRPIDMGFPNRQTLGGLVYHCYLEGRSLTDPGDIDFQGMLILPLKILAP